MAIPKLETDVQIVSKIPDYPGSEGGLSPDAFKAKFDEAPQIIKDFINNVLIAELNSLVDVQALLNNVLDSTLTLNNKAANAKVTGDELKKKLDKAGGQMSGILDMNGNEITKTGYPSAPSSAANKGYVDAKHKVFTASLAATVWTGEGPYTQTVPVEGILSTDNPHICLVPGDAVDTALAQEEAWGYVSRGVTADGSIAFTCYEDKPEVNIPLQIEVNR